MLFRIRGAQAALPAVLGSLPSTFWNAFDDLIVSSASCRRRQAGSLRSPSSGIELTKMFTGFDVAPGPARDILLFVKGERASHLGRGPKHQGTGRDVLCLMSPARWRR